MAEDRFVLELPPAPAYIGTARLFVGAVARHYGLDESAVEDAKIGVSEACTSAIRLREGGDVPSPVRVEIIPQQSSLTFEIQASVEPGDETPASTTDDLVRSLGLELVRALFPDVETVRGEHGSALRFTLPLENHVRN